MSKAKDVAAIKAAASSIGPVPRLSASRYGPGTTIFAQGDAAASVMYIEDGTVRLSVLSHAGREAVIAVLERGHFIGEGCLVGQPYRMATAEAMAACAIIIVEKQDMVRQLQTHAAFAEQFLTHMLTRNIRIEEDLIDQLFNSSEKRLARTLLLLARYGETEATHRALPKVSQETFGRDGWDHALACELLHEQVSEAGSSIKRWVEDQQLAAQCRAARLIT